MTSSDLRPAPRLLGSRVYHEPPAAQVSLNLNDGLTILYGLNGAGKTRLLDSLAACLQGTGRDTSTHVLLDLPDGSTAYNWVSQKVLKTYDADPNRRYWKSPPLASGPPLLRWATEYWFEVGGSVLVPDVESDPQNLIDEIVSVNTFALKATGVERGEWEVWLCLPADRAQMSAWSESVDRFQALVKNWTERFHDPASYSDELEDEVDDGLDPIDELALDLARLPVAGYLWQHLPILDFEFGLNQIVDMLNDGLPVPIVRLFSTSELPVTVDAERDAANIDQQTSGSFAEEFSDDLIVEESVIVTDEMDAWRERVEDSANSTFSLLLRDAPKLSLTIRAPGEWIHESALYWSASDDPRLNRYGVTLASLSRAEYRWATFAIRWALGDKESIIALIIDEPESALHRAAEGHMANGLERLAINGPQILVATHSPDLIDTRDATLYEVNKSSGRTRVRTLDQPKRASLDRLGLRPSDLLRRTRVFILVEGKHDEVVLRHLCREQLAEARAEIIAIRGGAKLPGTVESQMLFDYTDAHLVAVLDNVESTVVQTVWTQAKERYNADNASSAIEYLTTELRGRKGDEYKWISAWLSNSLDRGVHARFEPLGLAARDIIEYLPVDSIVPGSTSTWAQLRAEHDAARSTFGPSKDLRDFKIWLTRKKGGDTTVSNIERATKMVSEIHDDIQGIGYRIREVGMRRHS